MQQAGIDFRPNIWKWKAGNYSMFYVFIGSKITHDKMDNDNNRRKDGEKSWKR